MDQMSFQQPEQNKKEPKDISAMSKEELQDYLQQGTYGMQKLYHDTGHPQKAEQYGALQTDIQDQVYAGNARLLDIQDKSQLKGAAQKTRAILDEYSKINQDDDQALEKFTTNVARIGGPDLSKYDPDIRRQGFELWGKTFNDQMAQIVSSPRGRELYGDVVADTYDIAKNEPQRQLKKEQFISSDQGKQGIAFSNALKVNGISKGLYEVGHWSNPGVSDKPDMVNGAPTEETQPEEGKKRPPISEQKALLNEMLNRTSTPDALNDIEYLHKVGTELEQTYGQNIDFSSPQTLWKSVSRAARALDNENLQFGSGDAKSIPPAEAFKKSELNNLQQNRIEAYADYDAAPEDQREEKAAKVQQTTQQIHDFNIAHLDGASKDEYKTVSDQFNKDDVMLQKQEIALSNMLLAYANLDPREIGVGGHLVDESRDWLNEFVMGRGKEIKPGSSSREEYDYWAEQYKLAVIQNEGGARLMDKIGNPFKTADLNTIKNLWEATSTAAKMHREDMDKYNFYVGEHGVTTGAPTRKSYAAMTSAAAAKVAQELNQQAKTTKDGETLEQVSTKQSNTMPTLKGNQGFDLEAAKAEAARRGL